VVKAAMSRPTKHQLACQQAIEGSRQKRRRRDGPTAKARAHDEREQDEGVAVASGENDKGRGPENSGGNGRKERYPPVNYRPAGEPVQPAPPEEERDESGHLPPPASAASILAMNHPIPIPPSSKAASARAPCRQTLWRRRKKAEAVLREAALKPAPPASTEAGPASSLTHSRELAAALGRWPRSIPPSLKTEILKSAVADMKKLLKSKTRAPRGQDLTRHQQVLQFMNVQLKNSRESPRMVLAEIVANMHCKGRDVAERIIKTEKEWIKNRVVPSGQQGRSAKVPSMMEDAGTRAMVEEYVEAGGGAGGITAVGLKEKVERYWQGLSVKEREENRNRLTQEEASSDREEEDGNAISGKQRKLTVTTKTAGRWLQMLGYIFLDGKYVLGGEEGGGMGKSPGGDGEIRALIQVPPPQRAHDYQQGGEYQMPLGFGWSPPQP
jgi:hypothetical protein